MAILEKTRVVAWMILLISLSSCEQMARKDTVIQGFPLAADMMQAEAPLADTLFHGSCPIMTEGVEYVYLVNAACSYCIAKALECYQVYLTKDIVAPFYCLSRSEDYDIFDFYFRKRYSKRPSVFILQDHVTCSDGVFLIQDGRVVARKEWR